MNFVIPKTNYVDLQRCENSHLFQIYFLFCITLIVFFHQNYFKILICSLSDVSFVFLYLNCPSKRNCFFLKWNCFHMRLKIYRPFCLEPDVNDTLSFYEQFFWYFWDKANHYLFIFCISIYVSMFSSKPNL